MLRATSSFPVASGPRDRLCALREIHPFVPAAERHLAAVAPKRTHTEELLRRLGSAPGRSRDDLRGGSNRAGGSAGSLGSFVEIGREFLKASEHRRYPSVDLALECEWDDEMRRRRLEVYPPDRIWFLSFGADAAFWACSLTRKLPILRDAFNTGPVHELGFEPWEKYLEAFRLTFELARKEGVLLDCNPNNFGIAADRLYYVDDDLGVGTGRIAFGHQALLRLREYADSPLVGRRHFLLGFAELVEGLDGDEVVRHGLLEDLQQRIAWPRESELRSILEGLVKRLGPPARSF